MLKKAKRESTEKLGWVVREPISKEKYGAWAVDLEYSWLKETMLKHVCDGIVAIWINVLNNLATLHVSFNGPMAGGDYDDQMIELEIHPDVPKENRNRELNRLLNVIYEILNERKQCLLTAKRFFGELELPEDLERIVTGYIQLKRCEILVELRGGAPSGTNGSGERTLLEMAYWDEVL
jgi:hypothetical protein